jgi:hypothetical protein
MMDIQTDQTQPPEILLITQHVILVALIQAMDSIRQHTVLVGLMDTQPLGMLTMEDNHHNLIQAVLYILNHNTEV